jgi:hypothetical protein
MIKKPHTVKISLSDDELFMAWCQAEHHHIGGQNPIAAHLKEAAFGYFSKYPIPDHKKELLVSEYLIDHPDKKAAQLFAILGKSKGAEKETI